MSAEDEYQVKQYQVRGGGMEAVLGPLETAVMETIWSFKKTPITVREVYERLKEKREIAYTTVMTTMNKMFEKGLLDRKIERGKGGLYYVYWPKTGKEELKRSVARQIIDSLVKNFGDSVVAYLIEETALDEEKIGALRELLEKRMKEAEAKRR